MIEAKTTTGFQEYLEAIYHLQKEESPVSTSALAERLGVSPASASEMMHRLSAQGLTEGRHYEGVSLTETGRRLALATVRRHRLWERFLYDVLGMDWAELDDDACRLEHLTSKVVEERLARLLGEPESCPHGHPLPSAEGELQPELGVPLEELGPGQSGVIRLVPEGAKEMLQYLAELGLLPGRLVEVEEQAPFGGPLMVKAGGISRALARDLASKIMVSPL